VVAQILPSASGASVLGKNVRSTRHTSFLCDELTDCRSTRHVVKPFGQLVTQFLVWRVDWFPRQLAIQLWTQQHLFLIFYDVGLKELTGSITVVVLYDLASPFWFIQQFPPQHEHCTAGLYGRRTRSQQGWKMSPVLQPYCNRVTRPYNTAV